MPQSVTNAELLFADKSNIQITQSFWNAINVESILLKTESPNITGLGNISIQSVPFSNSGKVNLISSQGWCKLIFELMSNKYLVGPAGGQN